MWIRRMIMGNFRNHQETDLELGKINFFIGPNNAGKSSVLSAAEWGLTGRCLWTDRAGRGSGELLRQGAKQMSVALEVAGLGTILRSIPPHTLQVGSKTRCQEAQAAIFHALGCGEDRLRVACNTSCFLELSAAEQKDFLFNAYGLAFSAEGLEPQLAQWLAEAGLAQQKALALANRSKTYYPAGLTGGPEVLGIMEKKARDERKELKRDLKRLSAVLEETPLPASNLPVEELQRKLQQFREERDELLQRKGSLGQEQHQSLLQRLQDISEKLVGAREKAAQLTEQSKRLNHQTMLLETLEQQESELQDKFRMLSGQATALTVEQTEVQEWREDLEQAIEVLGAAERRCPLAPEHLRCALTEEQAGELVQSLQRASQTVVWDLERIGQKQHNTQQALERYQAELHKLQGQQAVAQEQYRQYLLLQSQLNTQQTLINQYNTEKAALQREFDQLPPMVPVVNLDEQLAAVEQQLVQTGEQLALVKRRAELERELGTITGELEDLELLIKALGPEGLKKQLLMSLLTQFLGRANDRLHRLTKGVYQLQLGPDSSLLCQVQKGPLLPLKLLSKSEQLRVGIALQEALSHAAGLNFLAIDEADMLDQENRDLLSSMLVELADEYDQVLVFTTLGDTPPQNPGLPDVKVFWVEEGNVKEMK